MTPEEFHRHECPCGEPVVAADGWTVRNEPVASPGDSLDVDRLPRVRLSGRDLAAADLPVPADIFVGWRKYEDFVPLSALRAALAASEKAVQGDYLEVRTTACHAGSDGDCSWSECPQVRDGEPAATGRHCPLDAAAQGDERLRERIVQYVTVAIMDLPNGGGLTWNEAQEVGEKVARLALAASGKEVGGG